MSSIVFAIGRGGFAPLIADAISYTCALQKYKLWLLTRFFESSLESHIQPIPGFGGFVCVINGVFARKSTIQFFIPIDDPFTEYSAIKELLKRSENARNEVGQKYVLRIFTLDHFMKALPLIWSQPERYQMYIITPHAFHTAMNFMGTITNAQDLGMLKFNWRATYRLGLHWIRS